jgi:hypothetical protein
MPLRIGWSVAVTVPSGPKLSVSRSVEVEAYDSIMVTVAKNTTNMSVELQPGGAGKVKFLAVLASRYEDLSFKVNATGSSASKVKLDQPQILVGDGAIELLASSPKKLFFTNASPTEDVSVEILVGRNS